MTMLLRALALLGAVAHGVNRVVARVLPFLPARIPGALVVASVLAGGSWWAAQSTSDAIAALPEPAPVTLDELTAGGASEWVSVRGLLSGPHIDNSLYSGEDPHYVTIRDDPHDREDPELVPSGPRTTIFAVGGGTAQRWFYVLRDPAQPDHGVVVRSPRDGDAIRLRTIRAEVAGTEGGLPLLRELELAGLEAPTSEAQALATPGAEVTVRGFFGSPTELPDGTWRYLVTGEAGDELARIDSPHPPNALPIELTGLMTDDAYHLGLVLETDEMRAALDGVTASSERLFSEGVTPMLPELSYLPAVILGLVAALLLASLLVGYPIFRRATGPLAPGPRPVVGEAIPLELSGVLPAADGRRRISGSAAELVWLPTRELERRAWQLRAAPRDAPAHDSSLVLIASEEAFLLPIEPLRDEISVERGEIVTVAGVRPGLRLRGPGLAATLVAEREADRDRTERELDPATPPAVADELPPPRPVAVRGGTARPRLIAGAALGAVGLVAIAAPIPGLLAGDAQAVAIALALLAAAVLLVLARGVLTRAAWARDMLPSVALVGLVVAPVIALAGVSCGSWLFPAVDACPAPDPFAIALPVVATVGFGASLWAAPRLRLERTA